MEKKTPRNASVIVSIRSGHMTPNNRTTRPYENKKSYFKETTHTLARTHMYTITNAQKTCIRIEKIIKFPAVSSSLRPVSRFGVELHPIMCIHKYIYTNDRKTLFIYFKNNSDFIFIFLFYFFEK